MKINIHKDLIILIELINNLQINTKKEIFTYFPVFTKLICKGEFNPKLIEEDIFSSDLFSFHGKYRTTIPIKAEIWNKFAHKIQLSKGAKRRDFNGEKLYSKYKNLISPIEVINKIRKEDMPKGIADFLLEDNGNYYGFSDRGRTAFREVYLDYKKEYEEQLEETLQNIKIMNDLLEESHRLKKTKAKDGCYTKYSVSDIPSFLWENIYPSIKDSYSLSKPTRSCNSNGKSGITFRFLKQMTNKYKNNEIKNPFREDTLIDNEESIRRWAKIELKNNKERFNIINNFFLNQEQIIKENKTQNKKAEDILNKREVYLYLEEEIAEKYKLNQLYNFNTLPNGLKHTSSALEGIYFEYNGEKINRGIKTVIFLNERWAELEVNYQWNYDNTIEEIEITDPFFIKKLNTLRNKSNKYLKLNLLEYTDPIYDIDWETFFLEIANEFKPNGTPFAQIESYDLNDYVNKFDGSFILKWANNDHNFEYIESLIEDDEIELAEFKKIVIAFFKELKKTYNSQINYLKGLPDKIIIYRGIGLDEEKIPKFVSFLKKERLMEGYNKIGRSWTLTKDVAFRVPFISGGYEDGIILEGIITKDLINYKETLLRNLNMYYGVDTEFDEDELTLREGVLVKIKKVEKVIFVSKEIIDSTPLERYLPALLNPTILKFQPFSSDSEFLNEWYLFNKKYEEGEFREDGASEEEILEWKEQWLKKKNNPYLTQYKRLILNYKKLPEILTVYRGLAVSDSEIFKQKSEINLSSMGNHWTLSKDVAIAFAEKNLSANKIYPMLILATIQKEDINWRKTILANTSIEWSSEEEIFIDNFDRLTIEKILILRKKDLFPFLKD